MNLTESTAGTMEFNEDGVELAKRRNDIAAAGGVAPLIEAVRTGTAQGKRDAADVLLHLSAGKGTATPASNLAVLHSTIATLLVTTDCATDLLAIVLDAAVEAPHRVQGLKMLAGASVELKSTLLAAGAPGAMLSGPFLSGSDDGQ